MAITAERQTRRHTRLKRLIDDRGHRYTWLADQLGISRSHLHRLLSGERALTDARAEQIAELIREPVESFHDRRGAA